MINRETFFKKLRVALFDKFSQLQVDSINAILDECDLQGVTDNRHIAYIFATAYHESMNIKTKERLVPCSEFGGTSYLQSKKYFPYYGRGFVQLTWDYNYKKYQKIISKIERFKGIDILANPDLAKEIKLASFIIVHGMVKGTFTGKKLSDYISTKTNFLDSRRIINCIDKASLIASYANGFLTALS
jgi:predicted chitinase